MYINQIINPKAKVRNGTVPDIIVFHYMNADYNTIVNSMKSDDTFTNFAIGKDGSISCFAPCECSGTANKTNDVLTSIDYYYGRSRNSIIRSRKDDANTYTVSITLEYRESDSSLSEECIQSIIWLVNYIRTAINNTYKIVIPIDTNHVITADKVNTVLRNSLYKPYDDFPYNRIYNALYPGSSTPVLNKYPAGTKTSLVKVNYYESVTSMNPKGKITGTIYLYNGILSGNRYAFVMDKEKIGAQPMNNIVYGYISLLDLEANNPITPSMSADLIKIDAQNINDVNLTDLLTLPADAAGINISAGSRIKLNNTPIYETSVSVDPKMYKTGTYYIYDGVLNGTRYRITNTSSNVRKLPVIDYSIGFIESSDITNSI